MSCILSVAFNGVCFDGLDEIGGVEGGMDLCITFTILDQRRSSA